jgi:hypothetical protein
MESKRSLCVRSPCTKIFLKIVREEKGEKHHFKRKAIEMETILNLCASREVAHKDHVKRT